MLVSQQEKMPGLTLCPGFMLESVEASDYWESHGNGNMILVTQLRGVALHLGELILRSDPVVSDFSFSVKVSFIPSLPATLTVSA